MNLCIYIFIDLYSYESMYLCMYHRLEALALPPEGGCGGLRPSLPEDRTHIPVSSVLPLSGGGPPPLGLGWQSRAVISVYLREFVPTP